MVISTKTISGWIRQTRYRAKKLNILSDITIDDVRTILLNSNYLCAYCCNESEILDCPFPLKENGPNVPANVVSSCKVCKSIKGNNDIIWMFVNGHIPQDKYIKLLDDLCKRRGGNLIKEHIRRTTGIIDDHE